MIALLDSSVLIEHLRGNVTATTLLLNTKRSDRLISALSRVEIEGGMRPGEESAIGALMGALTVVPVSDAIARRAGELLRKFRRSHSGIDLVDYVIAATAQLYDAPLLTLNVRHFPMFQDLKPAF
jgi:predicted nucleic acid-binding protein